MNIITLTVSPAIDVHYLCDTNGQYDSAKPQRRDSGGKGVNVSRALLSVGIDNLCCIAAGENNLDAYIEPLELMKMRLCVERVPGAIRENLNLHSEKGDHVIAGEGACVDISAVLRIKERLLPLVNDNTYLCFCGSITPKSAKGAILDMLKELKLLGAKLIIDCRSFGYADIAEIHPYLIKPNYAELLDLLGEERVEKLGITASAGLLRAEISDNALVTLGADGAVFACAEGIYRASAPTVQSISSAGAGDSSIAGLLSGISKGCSVEECIRESVAFGTASCMREGTLPPDVKDIDALRKSVTVSRVG